MPLFGRKKHAEAIQTARCDEHGPCRALAGITVADLPDRLGMLITPADPALGPDPVVQPFEGDLVIVLCVKGGQGQDGVTDALVIPEHLANQWSVTRDDLWGWAHANLAREQVNRQTFKADGGDSLHVVNGMGWPGAAQVLRVEAAFDLPLPHGAVVTLPTSNVVCGVPIRTAASLNKIPFLIQLTGELRTPDSGPFGTDMYWYIDGELENLNARLQDGQDARMRVSTRFKTMMESLPSQ
ncbi:hypothetical protein GXW82_33750 [Streptacidiphilus sp. 4-A2]|nr:hypothetical protein [Streptacidiphilus sp. 4-A2]